MNRVLEAVLLKLTLAPIKIRPYGLTDAEAVLALINRVCAEQTWFLTDAYTPTPEWENALWRPEEFLDHLLLVAQVQNQIVGWCQLFPLVFGNKSRHVAELGIGITREWREQGIGTSLIKTAIEWAKQHSFEKIIVSVFSTNMRAIHVYAKIGFQQTGVRYKQYKINDVFVDEVLMEYFLIA